MKLAKLQDTKSTIRFSAKLFRLKQRKRFDRGPRVVKKLGRLGLLKYCDREAA